MSKNQGLSLIGDEKEEALKKWIIQVQRDYYKDEMCSLRSTGAKKSSLTRQLNLLLVQFIWKWLKIKQYHHFYNRLDDLLAEEEYQR